MYKNPSSNETASAYKCTCINAITQLYKVLSTSLLEWQMTVQKHKQRNKYDEYPIETCKGSCIIY